MESRSSIDGMVSGQVEKLAEGRDILTRALESDLNKIAETRAASITSSPGKWTKIAEGREILTKALEADLSKVAVSRATIDAFITGQVQKFAEGRTLLTRRSRTISTKLAESRSSIDGLVAGQVEKLAAGSRYPDPGARSRPAEARGNARQCRSAGRRAGQEGRRRPGNPVAGPASRPPKGRRRPRRFRRRRGRSRRPARRRAGRAGARRSTRISASSPRRAGKSTRRSPVHIDTIAGKRVDISQAVAADVEKIEEAFRRQTGVIEERTGTMERALSIGVDNVRQVLEKSAVVVAGALRDKVLEVTSALNEEAGNAFTEADKRMAERAEQTSSALLARAEDIAKRLRRCGRQDCRPCPRNVEHAHRPRRGSWRGRSWRHAPARSPRSFDDADQKLIARAMETAGSLAARAGDILRNFDDADQRLGMRIGESADALAARAAELGRIFDRGRREARRPHRRRRGEARVCAPESSAASSTPPISALPTASPTAPPRSAPRPAKSSLTSRRPTSVWQPASAKRPACWPDARPRSVTCSWPPTGRSRPCGRDYPGAFGKGRRNRQPLRGALTSGCPARISESAFAIGEHADGIVSAFAETEQRVVAAHAADFRRTGSARPRHRGDAGGRRRAAAAGAQAVAARVDAQVEDAESRLAYSAETMGQKLNEQVAQAEAQLVSRANVIAETFAAVGQHIGQSTNEAAQDDRRQHPRTQRHAGERSAEITKILDETARPLVDRFAESGGRTAKKHGRRTDTRDRAAARRKRGAGQRARQPHRRNAVGGRGRAQQPLAESVAGLIGSLSASSSQLSELIERRPRRTWPMSTNG